MEIVFRKLQNVVITDGYSICAKVLKDNESKFHAVFVDNNNFK